MDGSKTGKRNVSTWQLTAQFCAAGNPRLAEGCHEVTYRVTGEREDRRAFVNAAGGSDPVKTVADAIGIYLRGPPRLARAARMVAYATPKLDPDRIIYGVRKLTAITVRELAIESGDEYLPAMPAGTRTDRLAVELETKVLASQRIELGSLAFDYDRIGIPARGMAIDIDTFLMTEHLLEAKKAVVKRRAESEANETSLPAAQADEVPAPVVPVSIQWASDPFNTWADERANTQDTPADNVVALPRPRPGPRLPWSSMRRSESGSSKLR